MIKRRKTNQISLFFFIFSVGCVITFIVLDLLFYSYNIKSRLMNNAIEIALQKEKELIESVEKKKDILLSIKNSYIFKEYQLYPNIFDEYVKDMFFAFSQQDKQIMQLRYIDKNGIEKIRIDRDKVSTLPFVVQKKDLQDKSNRYYFKDSIGKPYKVWYSNLDLNIEHGKVEKPYKPTLRAMLPIKLHNEFNGVLIINYHMKVVLDNITNIPSHDLVIMNENGFPLIHYDKTKNWGYYQQPKINLKDELDNYYPQILDNSSLKESDFISKKLNIELPEKLYFMIKLNEKYINSLSKDRYYHYLLISIIILTLSVLMSTVFSRYLRKIFVILKDVKSLNKLLNQKVKKQTQELKDSQDKLNSLINNINDFIWEVNEKGEYTYLSPQVEKILGYSPQELLGKKPFDLMPRKTRETIEKKFTDIIQEKKQIEQLKNKNIHKEGHIVYLETSGTPILNSFNEVIGYRGSDRDITQRVNDQKLLKDNYKKIEDLNNSLEEKIQEEVNKNQVKDMQLFAQSKMAAMGDMIANIAHQWRQPLSAISTLASGVKLKSEYSTINKQELENDMDLIVNKTQDLSNTIETFLSFVREKKQFQIVKLKDVLQKAIDMVESSLNNHFIKLTTNFDTVENVEITTVPSELQEVILNILNNAKDALKEKDIKNKKIHVQLIKNENSISINIVDNAGGIPLSIVDRVFEPYFTTKHETNGTGLGLHMSYRIITESLNGKIYAKNKEHGAIFIIELPLNKK